MPTATPIASENPRRKKRPSSKIKPRVIGISWPARARPNGFSVIWAAASEAEMVMVTTKAVSTKLISTSTRILPCHHERSRSSIEIDPSPWGLSAATRRYIGKAPKRVTSTRTRVAMGAKDAAVWRTHLLWSYPDGCTHVDWQSVPHDEPLLRRPELRTRLRASASFWCD